MEHKPWWQSRTLWVNAIAAALMALEASLNLLQPHLPVSIWVVFAVALPVVNAVLRAITTQALTLK